MSELEKKAKRDGVREQVARLQAELEEARKTIAELTTLNATLKEEYTRLASERDAYLESLYALTRKEFSFTKQELEDLRNSGASLGDLIKELEEARSG
jgi:chromosome segregation ATPase